MLRRFTKTVGRWREGSLHDWPLSTWNQLARDVKAKSIEEFSKPEEVSAVLTQRNRQGAVGRPRAGGQVGRQGPAS